MKTNLKLIDNQFHEINYPSSRQFTMDLGKIGREKHHVKALLEIDVTEARKKIKMNRQAGKKIAFLAWLIKVTADCIKLHQIVNGINQPKRNRVVVFYDVDLCVVVEKEVGGVRVPLPYVIRKANQKTYEQINAEIQQAKNQIVSDEGNYVLGTSYRTSLMKIFVRFPAWLRLMLMRIFVFDNPARVKNMMGTVMVTTVGMLGHTRGWLVPFSMHPLCLAFGSLNKQPRVYKGEIQIREILHLTVLIDHDVVDGMPAAKFVDDLVRKMEAGWEL